jgi:MFS family permease
MLMHIIDGALFMGGWVLFDQFTMMIAYIKNIYDNPVMIGLIPALLALGGSLPGFFMTPVLGRLKRRHGIIIVFASLQRAMLFACAFWTFAIVNLPPLQGAIGVLFWYMMISTAGSLGGPAWLDFVAKTVPVKMRSRVIAMRNLFGALAGILLPFLIQFIFSQKNLPFPVNYRILFFIGAGMIFLSLLAFVSIKETTDSKIKTSEKKEHYLKYLAGILVGDKNFSAFLAARIIWAVVMASVAYFTSYALDKFIDVTDVTIPGFLFALNLSKIIGGFVLGYVGDHKSNGMVQIIGTFCMAVAAVLTILLTQSWLFYIVFFLLGIVLSADLNATQVLVTEFGPEDERIHYMNIFNTIVNIFGFLAPLVLGLLLSVGVMTYSGLFIVSLVCTVFVLYMYLKVIKDPRHLYQ